MALFLHAERRAKQYESEGSEAPHRHGIDRLGNELIDDGVGTISRWRTLCWSPYAGLVPDRRVSASSLA
jgi:hypothetical protein